MATSTPASSISHPLFGGYALVAVTLAWIAGIALRSIEPLSLLLPWVWVAAAAGVPVLIVLLIFVRRRSPHRGVGARLALIVAILFFAIVLGAARAAWADPVSDPHAISYLPLNTQLRLRGEVAAEPDIRGGYRYLLVDVSAASLDNGATWRPAIGRADVTVYGADDWFAPDYGDTLSLSGTLDPLRPGAPTGVLAEMRGAQASILARGGGNPLLAMLFDLRLRLGESIQRLLPEPEAALLIGILLGFKTPVLRSRLSLFTATGTIHLVVPAGLKVAMLAEIAPRVTPAGAMAAAGWIACGGCALCRDWWGRASGCARRYHGRAARALRGAGTSLQRLHRAGAGGAAHDRHRAAADL